MVNCRNPIRRQITLTKGALPSENNQVRICIRVDHCMGPRSRGSVHGDPVISPLDRLEAIQVASLVAARPLKSTSWRGGPGRTGGFNASHSTWNAVHGPRLSHRIALGGLLTLIVTIVSLMGVSVPTVGASPGRLSPAGSDWPSYLDGPSHGSYNAAATSITPANISGLNPIWRWIPPASKVAASNALNASPTVVNGVVYIGSKDGEFMLSPRGAARSCGPTSSEPHASTRDSPRPRR